MTDDDENRRLDAEILDAERAALLRQIADDTLPFLDLQRQDDILRAEAAIARALADLEREQP